MTPTANAWQKILACDGCLLIPPDPEYGEIQIIDQVRPLRGAAAIVARARQDFMGLAHDVEVRLQERLVTDAGELAGMAVLAGRDHESGAALELTIGMIFGDDHYTEIRALAYQRAAFGGFRATVRQLVVGWELGLGTLRHRRFEYTPPAGWSGLARGAYTDWLAPRFPRELGVIAISPARPERSGRPATHEVALKERLFSVNVGPFETSSFTSRQGLRGQRFVASGDAGDGSGDVRRVELVALSDGTFVYPLRLETDADASPWSEARTAFKHVVDSVRALPRPVVAASTQFFAQWVDA